MKSYMGNLIKVIFFLGFNEDFSISTINYTKIIMEAPNAYILG